MAVNRSTLALLRKLMVSIGAETDQTTRDLTRAWIRSWDELSGAWKAGLQDTVKKAVDTGAWPQPWELARVERLRQAALDSEQALAKLGQEAGVTVADAAGRVIGIDADFEPKLIASQLPAAAQTEATLRAAGNILPTALNAITARTQSRIVAQTRTLSGPASEAMRRELIKGIAVGDNPRRAAAQMLSRVQGEFDGGLVRATTIARTEMLDAYRATSQYAHAANADVVASWVWHAQLDNRTCPSCWSQHGTEYPLTLPGPWDHPQGRCARLPKTKSWRDLGFDIDEPDDGLVDAEATFWRLPAADQKRIMGPGRLDLLRTGRIQWDDLSSVRSAADWRPSYTPRAVKDLRQVARLRAIGQEPTPPGGVLQVRPFSRGGATPPPPVTPTTGAEVRAVLAEATSIRRLEKAFTAEAERITGRRVPAEFFNQDLQTATEHAEGILRGLERFPDVRTQVFGIAVEKTPYAQTVIANGWIGFNRYFAGTGRRDLYLSSLARDVARGHRLESLSTPMATSVHEFGHALAVRQGFDNLAPHVSRVIGEIADQQGLHPVQVVGQALREYGASHLHETIAEAFADVVMNGERAALVSKRIYQVLEASYKAGRGQAVAAPGALAATPSTAAQRAAQRAAARMRNAEIELRSGIADAVAEFDEVIYKSAGQPVATVQALLRDRLSLATLDDATRKVLQRAVDTGDLAKIRSALTRTRTKFALKPVGRAGQKVRFDDALHTSVGRDPGDGAMVSVIRQGHTLDLGDGPIQLFKAKVTPVVAPAKKAAKKAAAGGQPTPQLLARRKRLAEIIKGQPSDVRQLGGGYIAYTDRLTYPDGSLVVRKVYGRRIPETAADLKRQLDAEELGSLVLQAVDAGAPVVIRGAARGELFMEHIDGETWEEVIFGPRRSKVPGLADLVDSPDGRRMGLADYLMANSDRNDGNWIIRPDGRLAGIDHGFAFERGANIGSVFARNLVDTYGLGRLLPSIAVDPEDVSLVRARLTALRPEFARLRRLGWHKEMMKRLKDLESRATPGSARLFT